MKTLILMRHGEAEQGNPDYARPLSDPGRMQCESVSRNLNNQHIRLDHVLCSSASRAKQSAKIVAKGLQFSGAIEASRMLYEATAGDYLQALQHTRPSVGTLLFVAHNPSISDLIEWLEGTEVVLDPAAYVILTRAIDNWRDLVRR